MVSSFLVSLVLFGTGQEMALRPSPERIKVGMTQKEVEKLLGETHQGENWFGSVYETICHYPRSRVSVSYDLNLRVTSVMLPTPLPKPDNTPVARIKEGMPKATAEEILGEKGEEKTMGFSYGDTFAVGVTHYNYPNNRVTITYGRKDEVIGVSKWSNPAPPKGVTTPAKPER